MYETHPLDPNVLLALDPNQQHEYRIYGTDDCSIWAVIDEDDYQWALQWKWSPKVSRGGKKVYLRRVTSEGTRETRYQTTVWLHVEIMKRSKKRRPSAKHTMVDHKDGDGFNCRRKNLRYATPSMNARNR